MSSNIFHATYIFKWTMIDPNVMGSLEVNGECHLQLQKGKSVPFTEEGFTLQLQGSLTTESIFQAMRFAYKPNNDPRSTSVYKKNQNYTLSNMIKKVVSVCAADFFKKHLTCRAKSLYCKMFVNELITKEITYSSGKLS